MRGRVCAAERGRGGARGGRLCRRGPREQPVVGEGDGGVEDGRRAAQPAQEREGGGEDGRGVGRVDEDRRRRPRAELLEQVERQPVRGAHQRERAARARQQRGRARGTSSLSGGEEFVGEVAVKDDGHAYRRSRNLGCRAAADQPPQTGARRRAAAARPEAPPGPRPPRRSPARSPAATQRPPGHAPSRTARAAGRGRGVARRRRRQPRRACHHASPQSSGCGRGGR